MGAIFKNELRVVLIGKTGSGKSTSGNTFLGREGFNTEVSGVSSTQTCSLKTARRFGKHLTVVDTPGLFDTGMSNVQVTKEIVKCVEMSSPGPHVFVLVVTVGRFTKEEHDTVQRFSEIFGEEMYNHMIVLFTRRDELDRENIDINEYIQRRSPPALQVIVQKCNRHVLAISNVQERNFREKDAEKFISLAGEVTRANRGSYYSNEMYKNAEKQLARRTNEVQRLKDLQKETEIRQIRKEIHFEKLNEIENMERQMQEEEKKVRENRDKIRELENNKSIRDMQTRNKCLRFQRERERMDKERKEMLTKLRNTEERENVLKRQIEIEKENKKLQSKKEVDFEHQSFIGIVGRHYVETAADNKRCFQLCTFRSFSAKSGSNAEFSFHKTWFYYSRKN